MEIIVVLFADLFSTFLPAQSPAERDELPANTVAVLTEFGAVPSQKAEEEQRGELFGKVEITNQVREEKREYSMEGTADGIDEYMEYCLSSSKYCG